MNKEAKVGDYIRTKTGIHKVFEIRKNAPMNRYMCDKKLTGEWDGSYEFNLIRVDDIINVSLNIMDLIQAGDYINGLPVSVNKYGELYTSYVYYGGDIGKQEEVYTIWLKDMKEDYIESILTKEQFKNMEYRIGDK